MNQDSNPRSHRPPPRQPSKIRGFGIILPSDIIGEIGMVKDPRHEAEYKALREGMAKTFETEKVKMDKVLEVLIQIRELLKVVLQK